MELAFVKHFTVKSHFTCIVLFLYFKQHVSFKFLKPVTVVYLRVQNSDR
jgi:hypothetical protein